MRSLHKHAWKRTAHPQMKSRPGWPASQCATKPFHGRSMTPRQGTTHGSRPSFLRKGLGANGAQHRAWTDPDCVCGPQLAFLVRLVDGPLNLTISTTSRGLPSRRSRLRACIFRRQSSGHEWQTQPSAFSRSHTRSATSPPIEIVHRISPKRH